MKYMKKDGRKEGINKRQEVGQEEKGRERKTRWKYRVIEIFLYRLIRKVDARKVAPLQMIMKLQEHQ